MNINERIEELMNAKHPVTLGTIARETGLTPLGAARALPAGSASFAPGADFETVWESLCSWKSATLFIEHAGHVFEVSARLAPGKTAGGFYNLMSRESPVGGHLKPELVSEIGFVSLPFMGRESHFAGFFSASGELMFSVYAGRENHKLIPEVRSAFLALKAKYESAFPRSRIRVIASSRTGNTRAVAERLAASFPGAAAERAEDAPPPEPGDTVFLGFWLDRGGIDETAARWLRAARDSGCRTALFGTMGGDPASERAKAFAEKLENGLRSEGANIAGPICLVQGKIDPAVTEAAGRMLGDKARDPARLARIEAASRHPDENDFRTVCGWAKSVLKL